MPHETQYEKRSGSLFRGCDDAACRPEFSWPWRLGPRVDEYAQNSVCGHAQPSRYPKSDQRAVVFALLDTPEDVPGPRCAPSSRLMSALPNYS